MSARSRASWSGLVVGALLLVAAFAVPLLTGWDVHPRTDDRGLAPLHGFWRPAVGVGTVPAVLLAVLGVRYAAGLAARLPWRGLLATSYAGALAWLLALALVDGSSGLDRALGNPDEYLRTARAVHDVPATMAEFVSRIPYSSPDNWTTHVAGHPVGALLFFVALVRLGLGGDLAAGLVVTVVAASIPAAVLVTLRALGAEAAARRAAAYLVLTPAAVFLAVSADAVFAAVAAWGLAALALGATAPGRGRWPAWSALAGLLLGTCVLLSYGLPLLGLLALAVLVAARSWRPLPVAAGAALVPVLVAAAYGFAWWEAYPVLVQRYDDGIARERPGSYWWWGNLAALLVSAGPLLAAGVGAWITRLRAPSDRVVFLLAGAALGMVALADASGMSKAEVERIWLPFVPWMTLTLTLLPDRWQRPALAAQVLAALAAQHLLYTSW